MSSIHFQVEHSKWGNTERLTKVMVTRQKQKQYNIIHDILLVLVGLHPSHLQRPTWLEHKVRQLVGTAVDVLWSITHSSPVRTLCWFSSIWQWLLRVDSLIWLGLSQHNILFSKLSPSAHIRSSTLKCHWRIQRTHQTLCQPSSISCHGKVLSKVVMAELNFIDFNYSALIQTKATQQVKCTPHAAPTTPITNIGLCIVVLIHHRTVYMPNTFGINCL